MFNWLIIRIQRLRWPILSKLLVSFSLTILILVVGNLIIIPSQLNLSSLDQEEQQKREVINSLQTIRSALNNQNSLYSDALYVLKDFQVKDNFSNEISLSIYNLKEKSRSVFTQAGYTQLLQLDKAYQNALLSLGQLIQKFNDGGVDQARPQWLTYSQAFRQAAESLDQLITNENTALTNLDNSKKAAFQQILVVTLVLGITSIIICVILAFIFSFSIGSPLRTIKLQLDRLAAGDLVGEIKLLNRDELGSIALIINNALANLRRVIGSTQIGESLLTLSQELTVVSRHQAEQANEQMLFLNNVLRAVQELNENAYQIADNTNEVVRASNLNSERIGTIAHITENVNEVSEQVGQVALETTLLVAETTQAVAQLKSRLEELNSNIVQITQINKIMDKVASDIHIVALNAAIEAAGAGAYGERFTRVARQVKDLVNDTRKSTVQIGGLLNAVQYSFDSATEQLDISLSKLQKMELGSYKLGHTIASLNSVVEEALQASVTISQVGTIVDEKTRKIQDAAGHQKEASGQILTFLNEINSRNQDNVYSSRQLAASTEKLDELALSLTQALASVKIN